MGVYATVEGDTFDLISRKEFGVETEAENIRKANPGLQEPLTGGLFILIPEQTDAPVNQAQKSDPENPNEIAMFIDGKRFRGFTNTVVTRSLDAISACTFSSVFEPTNLDFINIFRPFAYKDLRITIGDEDIFTGTLLNPKPKVSDDSAEISIDAYALPGVLQDCTPSSNSYPIEFNQLTLEEIAEQLVKPYGISVQFDNDSGASFERIAAQPQMSIIQFLAGLAKQRNLVISNTTDGKLLFRQSVETGNPTARLQEGFPSIISITPKFNAQQYYSHITGIQPVIVGITGQQLTQKNERYDGGRLRGHSFTVSDTFGADLNESVAAKMGRMFANAASYTVELSTWRKEIDKKLWVENETITLFAPSAFIFTDYEFIIRNVELSGEPSRQVATLELVLPGAFNGQIPESFPWDS